MGKRRQAITGARIAGEARLLLGVLFIHAGRSREMGIDCMGLLVLIAHALGIQITDVPNYSRADAKRLVRPHLELYCDPIEGESEAGDIALFRLDQGECHVAVLTGEGTMIHAWDAPSAGKVVEHRLDRFWESRIVRVYRFKEVQSG